MAWYNSILLRSRFYGLMYVNVSITTCKIGPSYVLRWPDLNLTPLKLAEEASQYLVLSFIANRIFLCFLLLWVVFTLKRSNPYFKACGDNIIWNV